MNVKGICKKANNNVILDDISLEFEEFGVVFVMGKSGAGKTTLFNVMSGIDSDYEGEIIYMDDNIREVEWYRRNILGIVFQDFNLISCLDVKENILLGIKIAGKDYNEEKYNEIIAVLDIEGIQNRKITNLSGGEKQRVAIARALLRDDKIIFADEPSGNLDEENTKLLFSYIKKLSEDRLFIIITHDGGIAEEFGDRIIEIRDGKICSDRKLSDEKGNKLCIEYEDYPKKNKNGWIVSYSLRNYWQRRKKTVGIVLITTVALLCIMFIMGFKSSIDNLFYQIDYGVLENDKFLYCELGDRGFRNTLSSDIVDKLEQKENVKNVKLFYEEGVYIITDIYEEQVVYDVIDDREFYKERYKDIEGKLPKDKDEVMIDVILAEKLFGKCESYLDKKFKLVDFAGTEREMTVTAVKLMSSKQNGEIYILDKLANELMVNNYNDSFWIGDDTEQTTTNSKIYTNEELLLGRAPETIHEVIISDIAVNEIGEVLNHNGIQYSLEDIQSGRIDTQLRKIILGKQVNLYQTSGYTNIGTFEIVGIYKSGENDIGNGICLNESIMERNVYNKINIYLNDISDESISDLEADLKVGDGYLERYSQGKSNIFQSKSSIIITGIAVLTIIMIVMAAMMVHFFVKLSIYERHYEIGVLLSLGMNIKSIRKILLLEQLIVSFSISALTILVTGIMNLLNVWDYCTVQGVSMYCFQYWHLLSIIIISCIFILVSSYPDIVSSTKKNIIGLLAEKQS